MHCNFTEITNLHGRSSGNLMHICRTPFLKSNSEDSFRILFCGDFYTVENKCFGLLRDDYFYQKDYFYLQTCPQRIFRFKRKTKKSIFFWVALRTRLFYSMIYFHCCLSTRQNNQNSMMVSLEKKVIRKLNACDTVCVKCATFRSKPCIVSLNVLSSCSILSTSFSWNFCSSDVPTFCSFHSFLYIFH